MSYLNDLLAKTPTGRCEFCDVDGATLPGWRHLVRTDRAGTEEHLWHCAGLFDGVTIHLGISVKRGAGYVVIKSMMQAKGASAVFEGGAPTVFAAWDQMLAVDPHTEESRADQLARNTKRARALRVNPPKLRGFHSEPYDSPF